MFEYLEMNNCLIKSIDGRYRIPIKFRCFCKTNTTLEIINNLQGFYFCMLSNRYQIILCFSDVYEVTIKYVDVWILALLNYAPACCDRRASARFCIRSSTQPFCSVCRLSQTGEQVGLPEVPLWTIKREFLCVRNILLNKQIISDITRFLPNKYHIQMNKILLRTDVIKIITKITHADANPINHSNSDFILLC